jgi:hypothetical protein
MGRQGIEKYRKKRNGCRRILFLLLFFDFYIDWKALPLAMNVASCLGYQRMGVMESGHELCFWFGHSRNQVHSGQEGISREQLDPFDVMSILVGMIQMPSHFHRGFKEFAFLDS